MLMVQVLVCASESGPVVRVRRKIMGSRRKRKANRSLLGAESVERVSRSSQAQSPPSLASAASAFLSSSSNQARRVLGSNPESLARSERNARSSDTHRTAPDGGPDSRPGGSNTAKNPRVELVTRQAEDG